MVRTGVALGLHVVPSPTESKRFGLSVARLVVRDPAASGDQVMSAVEDSGQDLVILRYPAGDVELAFGLERPGYRVWHADTLLYFEVSPNPVEPRTDGLAFRLLGPEDERVLGEAVSATFAGYRNHYAANPLIPPSASLAGYVEWAGSHLGTASRFAILAEDPSSRVVGVCTGQLAPEPEVTLAGVVPEFRGAGHYALLLAAVEAYVARTGARTLVISTQAGNRTAIRHWIARGYQFRSGIETVHIMKMVSIERISSGQSSARLTGGQGAIADGVPPSASISQHSV